MLEIFSTNMIKLIELIRLLCPTVDDIRSREPSASVGRLPQKSQLFFLLEAHHLHHVPEMIVFGDIQLERISGIGACQFCNKFIVIIAQLQVGRTVPAPSD